MSGKKKITVIGLGAMGSAIAKAFLKSNFETLVWNRSEEKAHKLISEGAKVASDIQEAFQNSPVIIICVLNYNIVDTLIKKNEKKLDGKIVVNLTNGTPEQAENTSNLVSERGGRYIDGGILAIPPSIGTRHASILYSGNIEAFQEIKEDLNVPGQTQFVGTSAGLASLYDLSLLSAMYGMFGGYLHAVSLLGSAKLKAMDFTPIVIDWLTAMMNAIPHLAKQIDSKDYSLNGVVSNIGMNITSVDNIISASDHLKISTDFIMPWKMLLPKAIELGHGDKDLSAIYSILKK